jgi:hypothetical protein
MRSRESVYDVCRIHNKSKKTTKTRTQKQKHTKRGKSDTYDNWCVGVVQAKQKQRVQEFKRETDIV